MKKKNLSLLAVLLLTLLLAIPASAATKNVKISSSVLQKGLQYTLVDMPYNGKYSPLPSTYKNKPFGVRTVQNFAVTPDKKYIFTVSEGWSDNNTTGKKHTVLTRCAVPSQKGTDAKAVYEQAIILDGYGHGETIAVTQKNLKSQVYEIWVACTPLAGDSRQLGTQIMRLTYKVTGNTGKITKKVKLYNFKKTSVKYAKKKTTAAFLGYSWGDQPSDTVRTGVSANMTDNKIAFRVLLANGRCYYVIYDFKKLNAALDKLANGKTYNMLNAAPYVQAVVYTNQNPYSAFQSFAIDKNNVYTCGGGLNKGAGINVIPYKTYKAGQAVEQNLNDPSAIKTFIDIVPEIVVTGTKYGKDKLEIEGLQIEAATGGKVSYYVNFYNSGVSIRDTIGIYKFTK